MSNQFKQKVKTVNQSTNEVVEITRYEKLNLALIELHIFGAMTESEQAKIGARLDKLAGIETNK